MAPSITQTVEQFRETTDKATAKTRNNGINYDNKLNNHCISHRTLLFNKTTKVDNVINEKRSTKFSEQINNRENNSNIKHSNETIHYSNDSKLNNRVHSNSTNVSIYDEALGRSKESKYMKPIRAWERSMGFMTPLIWSNSIAIIALHLVSTLWFLRDIVVIESPKWQTVLFTIFMGEVAGFGVTAGAHRYWCHRSYKARTPLQVLLLVCYSVAGQNTILDWVRDHRVHHKFSETSADPHDASRGLFFSHVGWLMMKKHPDVIREGRKMDLRDIVEDPLVQFHTRYFNVFKLLLCFVLPSLVPWLAWGESGRMATLSQFIRYMTSLNFTWCVNSFAHYWGNKPYDRHIMPAENLAVSIVALGEGWHNYHHTFPWDYKAAELGMACNLTTVLLDYFARIGWAYDLKEASPGLVKTVAANRGDASALQMDHKH